MKFTSTSRPLPKYPVWRFALDSLRRIFQPFGPLSPALRACPDGRITVLFPTVSYNVLPSKRNL